MTFNQITICALLNLLAIVFLITQDIRPKQETWTTIRQQSTTNGAMTP